MVKAGQSTADGGLRPFGFRNPDRKLGIEVVRYSELVLRLPAGVHRTDFHQIFVVAAGAATITVDFVDHACVEGSAIHVRPGQVLALPHSKENTLEATAVLVTPAFPQQNPSLINRALGTAGATAWQTHGAKRQALLATVRELHLAYGDAYVDEAHGELAVALVRQLLGVLLLRLSLLAAEQSAGPRSSHPAVVLFETELERSYATTRSAQDYAQRLGYSARTLNRACVATTGQTAKQLIDDRVALEAKRLLVHTLLPAAAIAYRLGFSEPTNFQKFFVRQTGEAPSAFRARESGQAMLR